MEGKFETHLLNDISINSVTDLDDLGIGEMDGVMRDEMQAETTTEMAATTGKDLKNETVPEVLKNEETNEERVGVIVSQPLNKNSNNINDNEKTNEKDTISEEGELSQ